MRPLRRPERFGIHGPSDAASALSSVRIVDSARSPSRPHVPPPRMEGRLYDLHLSADHPTRGSAGPRSAPRRKRHAPYAHDGRPLVHVDGRAVDEVAEYSLPNRTCDRRGGNRAHLPRRPADARRMRDIPPEKFEANSLGGDRQHEPRRKRRVRDIDLPIGRITPERAETYGLDYEKWYGSYQKALAVDLKKIQQAGAALAR